MNKTMLWVLLVVSAVFFLYPSVTTLFDVLDAIGNAPAIPTTVLETRDRAIMQVLGFVSLYVFLGALLYTYNMPTQQMRTRNNELLPQPQVRKRSLRIDPMWSFPAGVIITLLGLVFQLILGVFDSSDFMNGIALPILYSIGMGLVSGFVLYFVLKYLD